MFRKLWEYATSSIGFYFALFVFVWLVAWVCNGWLKTTFDLQKLQDIGQFILAKFGIDSGLNTKWGAKEIK